MFVLEREPLKGNRLFLSVFMGRSRSLNVWRCDTSVYVLANLAHKRKTVFYFSLLLKDIQLAVKFGFTCIMHHIYTRSLLFPDVYC